jgi:dolichol-phosphate mannosyltransferase
MPNRPLLAIPVFNEEKHVLSVLREAGRYIDEILVIDDGSTDSTAALLRGHRGLHVITHPENRGYGKSLADAFDFARRGGYDWLITMDCDEQHEPAQIPHFLDAASHGGADIISGTRYPGGEEAGFAPPDRRRINRIITDLLNQLLGLGITDAFCGFKAYRVAALSHLDITVPGYAMPMQMWVQVARAGLRVCELPVRLIYNDPTRHFGGLLDDPEVRLRHYVDVLESELAEPRAADFFRFRASRTCRSNDPCSTSRS